MFASFWGTVPNKKFTRFDLLCGARHGLHITFPQRVMDLPSTLETETFNYFPPNDVDRYSEYIGFLFLGHHTKKKPSTRKECVVGVMR